LKLCTTKQAITSTIPEAEMRMSRLCFHEKCHKPGDKEHTDNNSGMLRQPLSRTQYGLFITQ